MNPILGVVFHWLGGLASGSFYVSFRLVRNWSWETAWLVGGVFSWLVMPSLMAFLLVKDLPGVLVAQSPQTLAWTFLFGALWGVGGLTFGLTMLEGSFIDWSGDSDFDILDGDHRIRNMAQRRGIPYSPRLGRVSVGVPCASAAGAARARKGELT